jgi:hypothetical protein
MAISKHIILLKIGIAVSSLALFAFAVSAARILPLYPELVSIKAVRNIPEFIGQMLPPPAPYAVFAAIGIAVLFAFAGQICLFHFFERTQSVEIRFLSIFLFSLTFEVMRIAIPLKMAFNLSSYIPVIASRLIVFGRFYGLFPIFAAALYASGFKTRKDETVILTMAAAAMLFAFRLPIDTFNFDTNLYPVTGFSAIFTSTNIAIVLLAIYCFISGAYARGSREDYLLAPGVLAAVAGRAMLLNADTWQMLLPGAALLVFGVWFTGLQYRRMYLWV